MQDNKPETSKKSNSEKLAGMAELENLERADLVALLTMHYIERAENGEEPTLEEYTARYPELTAELKSNVSHYWLESRETLQSFKQEDLSHEYQFQIAARLKNPQERENSRQAVSRILEAVRGTSPVAEEKLESLYKTALKKKISPPQLAKTIGVSSDIMMALEQGMVNIAGIPRKLINRLSETLEVSAAQINAYLAGPAQASAMFHAEDKPTEAKRQDFADYIRQSQMLKPAEKEFWLHEIDTDTSN